MDLQTIATLSIRTKAILVGALILLVLYPGSVGRLAAQSGSKAGSAERAAAPPNSLTPQEKAAGWKLLFDGRTTNGWRGFRRDKFPEEGWSIEDGTIKHGRGNGEQSQNGGDIITVDQYANFELQA